MRKKNLPLSIFLLGGMSCVLLVLLGIFALRNIALDQELFRQNALTQGYWIARALESSHRMVTQEHDNVVRNIIRDIKRQSTVRFIVILDPVKKVLIASDATLEGTIWPGPLDAPPEHGTILKRDHRTMELAFPASFADSATTMHYHPQENGSLNTAKWLILGIDVATAHKHHRDIVIQTVIIFMSTVIFGLSAFVFLGIIQKYALAHASIAKLEHIKRQLASFVPGTVRRLIEENPEKPLLDKVERHATILFLDIEQYTKMAEVLPPDALNCLIERYFSVFLDLILSHGGEINETAGDGIMAIFTGKTPRAHALNAVKAAVAIQEQAQALNRAKASNDPAILVNIGMNTGQVLLGATMIKGTVGERFTYTASGMVTNIASRLCDLGQRGDIHLSAATAHLVMGRVPLQGPLEKRLKHVRGTLLVYKIEPTDRTEDHSE